jgi:hypothetical protein
MVVGVSGVKAEGLRSTPLFLRRRPTFKRQDYRAQFHKLTLGNIAGPGQSPLISQGFI